MNWAPKLYTLPYLFVGVFLLQWWVSEFFVNPEMVGGSFLSQTVIKLMPNKVKCVVKFFQNGI